MKKLYLITIGLVAIVSGLAIGFHFYILSVTTPINNQPIVTASYVDRAVSSMSLRDKVATLFILHTPGTDATKLVEYIAEYKPSGIILMPDNIPTTTTQLQAINAVIQSDKKLPILIATDEEGGVIARLASDSYPGATSLRNQPVSATQDAFSARSDLLKSVGINLNFGIVADVTSDPNSFIFNRVLGTDADSASQHVAAAVNGSKGKTLSTLKHFPGHGETVANSHLSIPIAGTTYSDWLSRVALPFEAGIKAGANLIMFGQLAYPSIDSLPATLSSKWHDILKNTLGFKGVTITDDMVMLQNSGDPSYSDPVKNAVEAINAGNNLLLYVTDHDDPKSMIDPNQLIDGVTQAVLDGQIKQSVIDSSVKQVLNLRYNVNN